MGGRYMLRLSIQSKGDISMQRHQYSHSFIFAFLLKIMEVFYRMSISRIGINAQSKVHVHVLKIV